MQGIGKLYSQLIFYIIFVVASFLALIWGAVIPCFRKVRSSCCAVVDGVGGGGGGGSSKCFACLCVCLFLDDCYDLIARRIAPATWMR
jgi:hypothetical protein